jgi:hypothetical protein
VSRSFSAVIGTAVVVALGAVAPAQAGGGADSDVTFRQSDNRPAIFKGKVLSEVDGCVVGRKVQIFRKQHGNEQKITKTFASESGKYSEKIPMQSGLKLFARVKSGETPGGVNCAGDDSPVIRAD